MDAELAKNTDMKHKMRKFMLHENAHLHDEDMSHSGLLDDTEARAIKK